MRTKMIISLAMAAGLVLPQLAQAKRATEMGGGSSSSSSASSSSSSSSTTSTRRSSPSLNTGMAGKIGISADSVKTAAGAAAGGLGITAPNAIGVRYWADDRMGWEGALLLGTNSNPGGSQTAFGVAGGVVYNWKKPSDNVLLQWIGRAGFSNSTTSSTTTTPLGSTTTSVNASVFYLMAGLGFEAFIPAWEAISVTGNVGFGLDSTNTAGISSTAIGMSSAGSSPISVGIHYYFD